MMLSSEKVSKETEFPQLTATIKTVPNALTKAWTTLHLEVPQEVSEIFNPTSSGTKSEESNEQVKPVRGIKLVKTEDGKYHLLVHKKELSKPLVAFVLALKKAIERFGLSVESIATSIEDPTGPRSPVEIHPNMMDWITWLSNPSALDWSKSRLDLSAIINFVYEVVLHGKQPFVSKRNVSSRSELYINSAINIICKLYLIDRDKWVRTFWHSIPCSKRERKNIQYHSLKKFESVMASAELMELPSDWSKLKEKQEALLSSYLELTGSHVEYKLKKTTEEVVSLVGKPFLKVLYDRIRVRNELLRRNKHGKNITVKLSDVLNEGLRQNMVSCLPFAPICALHRRNFFYEMRSIKRLPNKFNETVEGLPFNCKTPADYARYCKTHENLSPPREEDSLIEAISDSNEPE